MIMIPVSHRRGWSASRSAGRRRAGLFAGLMSWVTAFGLVGGLVVGGLVVAGLAGCEMGAEDQSNEDDAAPVRVALGALQSACAGDVNPLASAKQFRVCGRANVNLPNVGLAPRTFFDETVTAENGRLELSGLPANQGYQLTVVGLAEDGATTSLARADSVGIQVGATTEVELTLVPYNETACVSVQQAGNLPHRVFPAAVDIGGDRVLVTGGFSALSSDGKLLQAASDQSYIVNTRTGVATAGPKLNEGRAAHTMVHVASRNAVLVIGGMSEMPYSAGSSLAFGYDSTRALSSVEVIDLSGGTPTVLPGTLTLAAPRVFSQTTIFGGDRVMISGGGGWPNADAKFAKADFVGWDQETGAFKITSLDYSVLDTAPRSGHTVTLLGRETVNGVTQDVYLVWGGTSQDKVAYLLLLSTDLNAQPIFVPPTVTGDSPEKTAFHRAVSLGDGKVLVVGGATYGNGGLTAVNDSAAYLIDYGRTEGGTQSLSIKQLGGLPEGRVFHTATTHDNKRVAIVGGFTSLSGEGASSVVYFDGQSFTTSPAPAFPLAPRGGHAAIVTNGDALYLAGGVGELEDLKANESLLSEIFVPASVGYCDSPRFDADELKSD